MDQLGGRKAPSRAALSLSLFYSPPLSSSTLSRSRRLFPLALSLFLLVLFPSLPFPFEDSPGSFLAVVSSRRNRRVHGSYRGPSRPFLHCTRRAARDVARDFLLSRPRRASDRRYRRRKWRRKKKREEEEKKREREDVGSGRSVGRLLGALVKSGEINSLRKRRQS